MNDWFGAIPISVSFTSINDKSLCLAIDIQHPFDVYLRVIQEVENKRSAQAIFTDMPASKQYVSVISVWSWELKSCTKSCKTLPKGTSPQF